MKRTTTLLGLALLAASTFADSIDAYDFKMRLKIPHVYDNTQSLGYRKTQTQTITGTLLVKWTAESVLPEFEVVGLVNKTHKINGKNVTYECNVPYAKLNAIGNNKTKKFAKATCKFDLEAEPSYNLGEMDEDNGLYVTLSGFGSFSTKLKKGATKVSSISGRVSGTLGCGCAAYTHVSPTRYVGENGILLDFVDDVAATEGTWTMKYNKKLTAAYNE